jgi:hypothetical protein
MKKALSGYLLFLCLLVLFSCGKKLYTHQQVMQSFKTKDDILKHLGKPDEIKVGNEMEEWVYTKNIAYNKSQKRDTIFATSAHSDNIKPARITTRSKYIRFIFDEYGNVTGYKTLGVDFSQTKKQ